MTRKRNNKKNKIQAQGVVSRRTIPGAYDRIIKYPEMSTTVHNTEIIASVVSTLATSSYTTVFPVAPTFFTWLGAVAVNYSKFKFKKFKVTYVPSVGTTVSGNISMGFGYDMADIYPANNGGLGINVSGGLSDNDTIVNFRPSVMLSAWEENYIEFPPDRMKENRYLDNGDWSPATTTIDAALRRNWGSDGYVLVNGVGPASTTLGKIHIEYVVELINPIRSTLN